MNISTLDGEHYIPVLMFSYNTSFHLIIRTTPYELLYGMKTRMSSLTSMDIQQKFYGESFESERLQILQKALEIAKLNIENNQAKYKQQHDKKQNYIDFPLVKRYGFCKQISWLSINIGPKRIGPETIVKINEFCCKWKLENDGHKTFNVKWLNLFVPKDETDKEKDSQNEEDAMPQNNANITPDMTLPDVMLNFETFQNQRQNWTASISWIWASSN